MEEMYLAKKGMARIFREEEDLFELKEVKGTWDTIVEHAIKDKNGKLKTVWWCEEVDTFETCFIDPEYRVLYQITFCNSLEEAEEIMKNEEWEF